MPARACSRFDEYSIIKRVSQLSAIAKTAGSHVAKNQRLPRRKRIDDGRRETKRWKQSLLGRSNQRLNSKTKNPHFHASYAIMKTRGKEKTISRRKTTSRAAPSSNSPVNSTIAPLYRQEIVRKHKSKFFRSVLTTLTCNLSIVFSRDFLRARKKKDKKKCEVVSRCTTRNRFYCITLMRDTRKVSSEIYCVAACKRFRDDLSLSQF